MTYGENGAHIKDIVTMVMEEAENDETQETCKNG